MKKILTLLALSLAFVTTTFAQKDVQVEDPIKWNVKSHDFGTIKMGPAAEVTFKFKNNTNAPVVITDAHPSCGCTTMKDWPNEPIAPGESGQISIEFNSTGNSGKIDKTITVATNAEPNNIVLHLIGDVLGKEVMQQQDGKGMHMERTR